MQEGDGKAASRNPSCLSHGPEGQRETGLSLFSPCLSALGLHGGWSGSQNDQNELSRCGEAGPRGRDISDPAQSIPISKQRVEATSQVCFLGGPTCASQFLWTHPAILATGSEAGGKALPRGGGCRESSQGSGGRWL